LITLNVSRFKIRDYWQLYVKMKKIDILCVGEVLIDFIGHQAEVSLNNTSDFHRYLGGSPMNVAMNASKLGLHTAMVATIGDDGFGQYVIKKLQEAKISTDTIKIISDIPTSVIFVSRTAGTPDFIPYRAADAIISENQISTEVLENTTIYHTSCFALSKQPARNTILKKAEEAYNLGCKLSIDVNYAQKLWETREEAFEAIKRYCKYNPLIKISEDDMARLFEKKIPDDEIFDFFHQLGADTVCLTLGRKGVKLAQNGKETIKLPAIPIAEVKDATGAGDAFWAGFLFAYIKEKPPKECLAVALKLAALKLQNIGGLPDTINFLSEL